MKAGNAGGAHTPAAKGTNRILSREGGTWAPVQIFGLHQGRAREGCRYPAILQNTTLEEEGTVHLIA